MLRDTPFPALELLFVDRHIVDIHHP